MTLASRLDDLEGVVRQVERHDEEVRANVIELGVRLTEMCKRAVVYAQTDDFTIEHHHEDERIYGYLAVGQGGLILCHRSSWDDTWEPEEQQGYKITYPKSWPVEWLRVAATEENLQALVERVGATAKEVLAGRSSLAQQVRHATASRGAAVETELTKAAEEFGFPRLVEDWGRAHREIYVDPSGAITAASSLIESTLKHIIEKLGAALPNDQSIQPLFKVAAVALALGADDGDAEVRGIVRGVSSVVQNVGALRTKVGDAHGKGEAQRRGSVDEARLAVDLAGSTCTFLIRMLVSVEERRKASDVQNGNGAVAAS